MKKGLRFGGGIFFGIMLLVATFVFSVGFASAENTVNISSPIRYGNYSTTLNVSIYSNVINTTGPYNVTLYCNKSGGSVHSRNGVDVIPIVTLKNLSETGAADNGQLFYSATVAINTIVPRANESRIFNCSAYADNQTTQLWSNAIFENITFDSSPPDVNFTGITNTVNYGNYSTGILTINVSVRDNLRNLSAVYMRIIFSNGTDTGNWTRAFNTSATGHHYNITIDASTFQDGRYNITVYANDSSLVNGSGTSHSNLNNTERIHIAIDRTAPTGSASCTPNPVTSGATVTCSCSATDPISGLLSASITANPSTSDTGTFTSVCTMTDYSGNSGTASTTYNVELGGSGGGGPSGGTTPSTDKKTNQWTKITPGAATIMKNFNPAIGLKEIQITVNNNAQNVKITVTKYDSKPASVIVEKTGKVYKYLEIKEENLKEKLSKAVIKTQVLKSWMENQGLNKGDIALFKFDNSTSNWKELVTTLMGEDDNYYYYDAEVTSFSYFAIGDKISEIPAGEEESVTPTSSEEGEEKSKSVWLWAIVITMAVVIAVVGWVILSKKKRRR